MKYGSLEWFFSNGGLYLSNKAGAVSKLDFYSYNRLYSVWACMTSLPLLSHLWACMCMASSASAVSLLGLHGLLYLSCLTCGPARPTLPLLSHLWACMASSTSAVSPVVLHGLLYLCCLTCGPAWPPLPLLSHLWACMASSTSTVFWVQGKYTTSSLTDGTYSICHKLYKFFISASAIYFANLHHLQNV